MATTNLIITHIDSTLHDIELLVDDPTPLYSSPSILLFEVLRFRLRNLKKFVQICGKQRSFTSISIGIEETVRGRAEQIHLGCQTDDSFLLHELTYDFTDDIISLCETIDEWFYSWESSTSLMPDAVQDIISFISEALVDFRRLESYDDHIYEAVDNLEEQMSFMKRLICYLATNISGKSLLDLLAHVEVVTIKALCLLFTYPKWWRDFVSDISLFLQKNLEPVYETYTQALSSLSLSGRLVWDDIDAFTAMKDFVDSLISNLWDLLRGLVTLEVRNWRTIFPITSYLSQDVRELYGGFRSLRTVLKQSNNLSMKIKEDIGKTVCDAAVFICSLHLRGREVDHGILENLLDTINSILPEIEAQEPQAPMLHFPGQEDRFNTSIKASPSEGEVKEMPSEGASSSTNEETQIVDQLTRGSARLQIVAIVGMPGLGKTTLAAKVYNNVFVSFHFHVRAVCSVSHVVDKKKVLLDLLNQTCSEQCSKTSTEQDLAEALRKSLIGRKYLIFLDDMWDLEAWTFLRESFPDDNTGSRILLTSRRHDVAPHDLMVFGRPYFLRLLNEEESLELLQRKLSFRLSLDLWMKIADKCLGLPLIIVIVAGVLKHAEPEGWDELLDCLSNVSIMDQCRNTLELSYKNLPVHLRQCLLYFGSFPENTEVPVRRLLRLWIAEGFIQIDNRNSLEDAAEVLE